jgi:putative FmdB family regulatory protein
LLAQITSEVHLMPEYEYVCQKCGKSFSVQMSVHEHDEHVPRCPNCQDAEQVQRAISYFNVQTSRKA